MLKKKVGGHRYRSIWYDDDDEHVIPSAVCILLLQLEKYRLNNARDYFLYHKY